MTQPWGKFEDAAKELAVVQPEPAAPISWEDLIRVHRRLAEEWVKPRLVEIRVSRDTAQEWIEKWAPTMFDRIPFMPESLLGIPLRIDDEIPRGEARYFDQYGDQMDVAW